MQSQAGTQPARELTPGVLIPFPQKLDFLQDVGPVYAGALLGDRMRLRQVLANGLSNATKFTDHGAITLRVRQARETTRRVELEFQIIDAGCGIAPDVLPNLFQPFRQADTSTARRYGGTGLGLVITRELVMMMGGQVGLASAEGKGTTMTITVGFDKEVVADREGGETDSGVRAEQRPGTRAETELGERVAALKQRRRPETVHILLAEDNELLRTLIVRTLQKMKVSRARLPAFSLSTDPVADLSVFSVDHSSMSSPSTTGSKPSKRCAGIRTTSS